MAEVAVDRLPAGWSHGHRHHRERSKALRGLPRRVRVLLAAEWARSVLPVFESQYPGDVRPRKAIEAAERWACNPKIAEASCASRASRDAYAATYAAEAAFVALAAYAAYAVAAAAADADADAADAVSHVADAISHAAAATRQSPWTWLYATYCRARGPVGATFDPSWKTDTAVAIARGIVADRATDRFPILTDALEDAGCDLYDHLAHMREDRGEWNLADWAIWNLLGYGD